MILPSRLKPLVFNKLHVDMGRLEYYRTLELIKKRFFWHKMYDDVKYFVTKISPMELIGLDFLHLDTCRCGFQYLLAITDHLQDTLKFTPQRTKRQKQQLSSLMITY